MSWSRLAVWAAVACLPSRLALAAETSPDFDVATTTISLAVAQCGDDCPISALFAPVVGLIRSSVAITNTSSVPLALSVSVDANGTYPSSWGAAVAACVQPPRASQDGSCPADVTVPVGGRAVLRVKVDASRGLPPGKYDANLVLSAIDASAAKPADPATSAPPPPRTKTITLTTRVRANVIWPLIIILAGVIGGRLFKQITSQDAVQLMALYGRYLRLTESPPLDASDPLAPWWNNQLETIKTQLDQSAPDMAAIQASIKQLEDTSALISSIASVRAFVNNLPSADPRRGKVWTDLQAVLAAIVRGNLDQAKTSYESAITDAFAVTAASPPVLAALSTIDPGVRARFAALDAASSSTRNLAGKARTNVISALNWISGDTSVPVEAAYSYVRPIMTLALVAVLTVYGVWQYYSGSDDVASTFGAAGISSYAILFLWGFSSQVIAYTLQTLKFEQPTIPR
jgi:hypothetical protein